jgi:hypothetical protein
MPTTTTNIIESLKYTYGVKKVLAIFNTESPTWAMLGKTKKPMGGRGQFIMPVLVKNPGTFVGIAEGGSLPTSPVTADTAEATFALQEYVGIYDMTWKLIQDASKDKFAFQQALQFMEENFRNRIAKNLNSDLVSDGRGALAFLPAADNTSPIVVSALPRAETGMVVDVMATADDDTKRANSVTVDGVDVQARTIKTSGNPSSTAAGDYFVLEDTTDISVQALALHSNGLLSVIDSSNPATVVGNYGGINRSTAGNEFWIPFELGNSGANRPLTEDLMLQLQDGVREKGGGMLNAYLSNLALIRRYHEMLAGERYFALSKPGVLEGGIGRREKKVAEDGLTPYEFSGIPWYADPYFDPNVVVGLDTNHFFIGTGENEVPRPISEIFDNVPFFRQTSSATFEVAWYYQMELLSDNVAAGGKIVDVAET